MAPMFAGIVYYLSPSLPSQTRSELQRALNGNGATQTQTPASATHILTDTMQFEGWEDVPNSVIRVTPRWVLRCLGHDKWQDPKFYSPDPAQLFSGIVACASDIPQGDKEAISGALVAFGGQWRQALTRDVTHLFALAPVGEKYKKAMLYKQNMAHQTLDDDDDILTMHVVLPHWFDDSFKLQTLLPTAPYEFPNPHILSVSGAFSASGSDKLNERGRGDANSDMGFAMRLKVATQRARDRDRAALLKSVAHSEKNGGIGSLLGPGRVSEGGVWGGRRIMFSESLEVDEMRRGSLEVSVSRAGGVVVAVGHEGAEMENVDILITRYRGGDEFDRALKVHKTIGTLAWLFHVEQTGRLTAPVDRLLHFPVPRDPIEGFVGADITVTNYAGEARDYLKKLITTIGGSFSPTMSAKTSYVIAAYIGGAKTTRARDWDIPVVNHTYLEDCFVEWRKINLVGGTGKYAAPETPGVNLMCVLGERGLGKIVAGVGPVDASVRRKERKETKGKSSEEAREAAKDVGGPSKTAGRARSADEAKTAAKKQPLITNADGMHADHADGVAGDQPDDVEMQAPDNDDDDLQPPVEMDIDRPPPRTPPRSSSPKRPFIAKPMKPTSATTDDLPMETEGEPAPALDPVTPKPPAKRVKRAPKVKPTSEIEDAPSASTSAPTSNPVLSRGREEDQAQPVLHHRTSSSSTAMRLPNIASSPPNPNHLSTPSGPSSARRPSGLMRGTDPDAILPTSSRRKAGMAATKKLHEEIMPDVMQYQKQMRSTQGDVRRMKLGEKRTRANESEDDEEGAESEREAEKEAEGAKEKERKKEKETVVKDKGKGKQKEKVEDEKPVRQPPAKVQKTQKSQNAPRNSAGTQRAKSKEDSPLSSLESEDDGPPPAPAPVEPQKGAKMIKKAQVRRKSAPEKVDDDPSDAGTQTTKAKGGRDADTASVASFAGSAKSSKVVRIMTTQVSLSDADVKALGKLGAKITVKPAECTHLVAKSIGRTEKFLCAMPLSPYILSENWIRSSIAAKKLLDEESYLLKDPANEAKYNFKLSEALERAKEGKLLEGLTFYVTPKVSVEFKTLKNVVSSAGGNLVKQTPTSRVLSSAKDRVRTKSNLGASSASSALSVEQASIDVAEVDDPNPPATLAIPTIAVTPPTVSPEAHLGQESSPPLNAAAADHIDQSSDGHNFPLHLDILITNKRGWIKTVHLDEYTEALEGLAWNEMVLLTEVELIEKGVVSVEARRELIKYFNAIINALEIDAEHSTGKNHQLLRELFAPNFGTNPGTDNPGPRSASSRKRARKRARQAASREGTST